MRAHRFTSAEGFFITSFSFRKDFNETDTRGLLGIGTVGGGTFAVLRRNQEEISRRAAAASSSRCRRQGPGRARKVVGDAAEITDDAYRWYAIPKSTS